MSQPQTVTWALRNVTSMGRRGKVRTSVDGSHRGAAVQVVHDRYWAREVRSAVFYGVLLFGTLMLLDWASSELALVRAAGWGALAVLLAIILTPPRVSATGCRLQARGLLAHHRVHTDHLVAVRISEGVAQRLILSDTSGGRLVLDPRVLVANPLLWHQLDQGARRSIEQETLQCGLPVLERLGRRIDAEVCGGILRVSSAE